MSIGYADGTSSPGAVLATDAVTDLAVVRTERTGLPVPEYRATLPRPGDPVLGVSLARLTPDLTRALGVQVDSGALVTGVDEAGPAATAGVRPGDGDVITGLAGRPVGAWRTCSAHCAAPNRAGRPNSPSSAGRSGSR